MTQPTPRPVIAAMPAYVPGARGQAGGEPPVKLSSNENPYGPLPSVVDTVADALTQINRYPDMFAVELTARLAEGIDLSPDQVVVGGGSVAVLGHILQAYCDPGDQVMFAWRSFEAYPILTELVGATPVPVPLTAQSRHNIEAMLAALTDRVKVALLCSPNNPTGPALTESEFEAFMAGCPRDVLVVLDEAYVEFVEDPATVDGLAALTRHPNLVLLRTFSKAYGLAGMRVGYAAGPAALIGPVRSCVTPFSVSLLAQVAAVASLDAHCELEERVEQLKAERTRVVAALRDAGWDVPDAQGNFFWLPLGDDALALASFLSGRDLPVLVRPFAGDGVRVSIGSAEENDTLMAALADYPGSKGTPPTV